MPHGLIRTTRLPPWAQGLGPANEALLGGGVRVFGVCLESGALGGARLPLGLISRWRETWPARLPVLRGRPVSVLRGRPVSVLAAVVPAAVVALVLCASSASLIVLSVAGGAPWLVLVIPTPVWGAALPTYACRRRRTKPPAAGGHRATRQRTGIRG